MRKKDSFINRTLGFVMGAVATLIISGGAVYAITNEFSDHVNILDDKALQLGTDLDIQIVYDEVTDNRLEFTDGTNLLMHITDAGTTGNLGVTGTLSVTGTTNSIAAASFGTAASVKGIINIERAAALNGYIKMTSSNGTDVYLFVDNAGNWRKHNVAPTADGDGTQLAVGSLNDLVDDLTPQLGGSLDVNSFSIISASDGDVPLTPNGTGDLILDGVKWPQADGTSGQALVTDGAGQTSWSSTTGGDMNDLIDDLTPQLGGPLDVVTEEIISTGTNDIDLHSNDDVIIELGDTAGANELSIRDSSGAEVAIIDSNGTAGFGTAAPAQKMHIFVNSTGSTRLRVENSEGFADFVADGGSASIFGGDGFEKMRFEATAIKAFQGFQPDITASKDLGSDAIRWDDLWAQRIHLNEGATITQTLTVGEGDAVDGHIIIEDGLANEPGVLELHATDGSSWFFWTESDGTLRFKATTPTSDADGTAVDGGTTSVVSDLTPQLGGDLDVNSNSIVSASGGNIAITPNTSGSIILDGVNWPQTDGSANNTLTTNGSGQLSWTNIAAGIADVEADTTPQLGGDLDVNGNSIISASSGDIAITPNGTGDIILDGQKFPQADGAASQVLSTNGSGQLAWVTDGKSRFVTIMLSDQVGTSITTGTAKVTWRTPYAMTVTSVRAFLKGASSSGLPTFDINESGFTVLSTKITIDASELTSTTAVTAPVLSDTSWADDAEMTFDIDIAGTGADGAGITIIYDRT